MFLRIAGAQSAEQSGIKGAKRPFDPDIMSSNSVDGLTQRWLERSAGYEGKFSDYNRP